MLEQWAGGWGGDPSPPDLWKHAEVGTTGSNQGKIRPATGARLLVNVCNVCQRSPSACLLCSRATLMRARSIRSDPFSSPDNQDDRQSRALLHFVLISPTPQPPTTHPPPLLTLHGVMYRTEGLCDVCSARCIYIYFQHVHSGRYLPVELHL